MKNVFLALIFAAGFCSLEAATVSVLVIETGLPAGAGLTESATVWESGFMDACFDAGHIVSNAPALRLSSAPADEFPPEAQREFDQARIGGADYLVVVFLNYPGEITTEKPRPSEVSIKVFNVFSGELVYKLPVRVPVRGNREEEFLDAKRNAGSVMFRLSLKTR